VLSITATILLVANIIAPHRAAADFAVKERVYTAVTAHTAAGGDALFITDNFTGEMGVFINVPGQGLALKGKLRLGR
jgi:hypothetical protein